MVSCYDCIHCEACSDAGDSGYSCLKEDVSKCKHFKNKADFVEVVRCKECKFYKTRKQSARRENKKKSCCRSANIKVNENDFCSFGEKE